ncbi:MAG: ion transporter [Blastomonas sp.]
MTLRQRIYHMLEPRANPERLTRTNLLICLLVLFAAGLAILETEESIRIAHARLFRIAHIGFGSFFLGEFLLRLWAAAEDPRCAGSRLGRLRWLLTPSAIIDMIALAPLFLTLMSTSTIWLRLARIIRILRIVRMGRMSRAFDEIVMAVYQRRFELYVGIIMMALMMLGSAALLYFAEAEAQPETFGSIPRAMWWAIVTLTTIGYGDAYPVTVIGKFCAAIIAIAGIGVIAIPTGILAAAFSDAMQKQRDPE